jgi:hypothetical protein
VEVPTGNICKKNIVVKDLNILATNNPLKQLFYGLRSLKDFQLIFETFGDMEKEYYVFFSITFLEFSIKL